MPAPADLRVSVTLKGDVNSPSYLLRAALALRLAGTGKTTRDTLPTPPPEAAPPSGEAAALAVAAE